MKIKVGVITEDKSKILLIKEKYKKKPKPLWNIIKGTYEPEKDDNFIQTAIREAEEEVSLEIEITHLINMQLVKDYGDEKLQLNYLGKIINGTPKLANKSTQDLLNEKIIDFKWFNKEELEKMNEEDFISRRVYKVVQDWTRGKKYFPGIVESI